MRSREFRICSVRQVEHLLRILEALSFWYARLYWFVKWPTIFLPSSKFVTLCPPQGIFALQKFLRAGCDGGRVTSSQREKSPRKEISRGNLLCAESGLTNLSYLRLLSVQKYVSTLNWYNRPYRAAWGARGAAAPLFPKESRENPFEGFSLGNFFLTADAVLLCAAKKNSDSRWRLCRLTDMGCRAGVGTTRLAGFCQFSPDPWVTHSSKKPHTVGSGK